jgi:hypothetical protein
MATSINENVVKLSLDLKNYRNVPQKNEIDAINAIINTSADRFYAILESLMVDGYMPTENIIILKDGKTLIVREGNRRIAAMKLIHGHHKLNDFDLPEHLIEQIKAIDKKWKSENKEVPCTIYEKEEADKVDKVVALLRLKVKKLVVNLGLLLQLLATIVNYTIRDDIFYMTYNILLLHPIKGRRFLFFPIKLNCQKNAH